MVWDDRIDEKLRNIDAYNGGKSDGIEEGIREGIREGIQKGSLDTKREIILNLNNKKISKEVIAECTHLSVSEVNKIIQDNNIKND